MPFLLLLLSVLLDISVLPLVIPRFALMVSLMTVVTLGLLLGRTRGALYGLIGGLLMDVLVGSQFGLTTLVYVACGYISGIAGRKYQRYLLTTLIAPLICYLLYELVMVGYVYMVNAQVEMLIVRDALILVLVQVALTQLLYLLYNRILKPSWSRYAGR